MKLVMLGVLVATLGGAPVQGQGAGANSLTLRVEQGELFVGTEAVPLPTDRNVLVGLFGEPSRSSTGGTTTLTWDEQGLVANVLENGLVSRIIVAFGAMPTDYWPRKPFTGALVLDGAAVHANATIASINGAKRGAPLVVDSRMPWTADATIGDVIVSVAAGKNRRRDAKGTVVDLTIVVTPEGQRRASVTGRIIEARTGSPIVGATISVDSIQKAATDADGRYSIDAFRGPLALTITASGHEPVRRNLKLAARSTTLDLKLENVEIRDHARIMISSSYTEATRFVDQYPASTLIPAVRDRLASFEKATVGSNLLVPWDDIRRSNRSDLPQRYTGRELPQTLAEVMRGRPMNVVIGWVLLQAKGQGLYSADRVRIIKEDASAATAKPLTTCAITVTPRRGVTSMLFDFGEAGCWDLDGPAVPVGSRIAFPWSDPIHILGLDLAGGELTVRADGLLLHPRTTVYWAPRKTVSNR